MDTEHLWDQVAVLPDGRMSARSAAAYLGLSVKTLAMKRCSNQGPPFIKRGRIFYFKKDLDSWVEAGRAESTAQARFHGAPGKGNDQGPAASLLETN